MGRRVSGNAGAVGSSSVRAIAASQQVPLAPGALFTLTKASLLPPVTFSKTGGSANLTVNAATGIVSAANALASGASQSASGTIAGADGVTIPYTVTLTGIASAPAVPAAPTLVATAAGNQVTLSWTDGADNGAAITAHTLYRGTGAGAIGAASPFVDTGLTNGTRYYYRLSATNSVGEGAQSAEQSAIPVASGPALAELRLDSTAASVGTPWTPHAGGYSAGSMLSATASDGTTLTGTADVLAGTFATSGSSSVTVTETLASAANSPRASAPVPVTVVPALGAAMRQIGTHCYAPNNATAGAGATTYRTGHIIRRNLASGTTLRVIYPNHWYDAGAGGNTDETTLGQVVTTSIAAITLNVEYPAGTVIGTASVSGGGFGDFITLAVTLTAAIPADAKVILAPTVTPGSGGAIPFTFTNANVQWDGEAAEQFYPMVIAATSTAPAFLLIGTSRTVGYAGPPNARGDSGELAPAIGPSFPYCNLGVSTARIFWMTRYWRNQLAALLPYFSHVAVGGPINDSRPIRGNSTAAQIMGDINQLAELTPGKPIVIATSPPAQVTATTIDTGDAIRLAVNAGIRSLAAPYNGYLEIARVFDGNDDGIWDDASRTGDYVHANAAGAELVRTSGNVSAGALAAMTAQPRLWSPTLALTGTTNRAGIFDASNASCTGRVLGAGGSSYLWTALNSLGTLNQTTAAKKPTLASAAIGGRPAFVFAASTAQDMAGGSKLRAVSNGATGMLIHALVKPDTFTGSTMTIGLASVDGTANARIGISIATTGVLRLVSRRLAGDGTVISDGATVLAAGSSYIVSAYIDYATGALSIRLNGTAEPLTIATASWTGGYGTLPASDSMAVSVGSTSTGSYFNGAVGLIDFFAGQRSTDELIRLEGRTAYDWGLQGLLPAGHAYKAAPPMAP